MNKDVLIINDVTGYGRVSSFAILPVMSSYGIHPYVLPTSLVSNTMDYGSSVILDTSDFMRSTINKWDEFGFKFSNICTGFINSAEQLDIIIDLIRKQDSPFVLVDPIMADDGELYPNMYKGSIDCNRKLAKYADVLIPNLTEAELLADKYIGESILDDNQYQELLHDISELGPNSIIITGCKSVDDAYFNLVYTSSDDKINKIPYDIIPGHYVGTGDVFSACLMSELILGNTLIHSVSSAANFVRQIILDNKDNKDCFDLRIEKSLGLIQFEQL